MPYHTRIVETPLTRRVYTYNNQVPSDFETHRNDYTKALTGSKQDSSIKRARDRLGLLIQCNIKPYSKFITFTTQENIKDRSQFLEKFKYFLKAFQREHGFRIKYNAVMETQKRGAWHIHMIAYNLTEKLDIPKLDRLWQKSAGRGHVDIKVVDSYLNMFKYVIKYLTKEEVKINKKAVLSSQGLKRPKVSVSFAKLDLTDLWGFPNYISEYSLYHGDFKNDFENNKLNPTRLNYCVMSEWHLYDKKGKKKDLKWRFDKQSINPDGLPRL